MSQVALSPIDSSLENSLSSDDNISSFQSELAEFLTSKLSFPNEESKEIAKVFVNEIKGIQNLPFADSERVKSALSDLTSFECGKEQLRNLAEICGRNGLKICFALNDNCSFENKESNGSKFLVVSIPEDISTLSNRTFFKTSYLTCGARNIRFFEIIK